MYYRSDSIRKSRNTFFDAGIMSLCASDGEFNYIAERYYYQNNKWQSTGEWYPTGIRIVKGKYYNMSFTYNKEDADSTFILRVIDEDGNMQKKVFSASVDPYYHQNIDSAEIRKIARRLIYFGNRVMAEIPIALPISTSVASGARLSPMPS